jgi:Ca2+-binding RTX toxin-like protein
MHSASARMLWLAALAAFVALLLLGGASAQASPRCAHLVGGNGPDAFNGRGGPDCLRGGPGADFMDGGRGKDVLVGGAGLDQLLAGAGRDRVSAGPGDDLISAQDDRADTVRCGSGNDLASVDALDIVTGCEKVNLTAANVEWRQFSTHINAYGKNLVTRSGWGYCRGNTSYQATCTGGAEAGTSPFGSGPMTMNWERASDGPGQSVTIKATDADAQMEGRSDPGWVWTRIDTARIRQWGVDPRNGIIRSGDDTRLVGKQGGPLQAYLSFHSFSTFDPREAGYSLDLQGWLQIIRF